MSCSYGKGVKMQVVVTFLNKPTVVLEVPDGTRWIYVGRDPAGRAEIVTHDWDELGRWMNDPARKAPWIEPREVFGNQAEDAAIEMEIERVRAA